MQRLRRRFELHDLRIGLRPDRDRSRHEADVSKAPEQVDHALDVGGMVACAPEARADDLQVRLGLVELDARVAHAGGDGNLGKVALIGIVVACLRILREMSDRRLLRLRPQALRAHERAHPRHHVQAGVAQQQQQRDGREERPDDEQPPPRTRGRSGN
jgi:hypothetical protein